MGFSTFMSIIYTMNQKYCGLWDDLDRNRDTWGLRSKLSQEGLGRAFLTHLLSQNQDHMNTKTEIAPLHSPCFSMKWQFPLGIELTIWQWFLAANFLVSLLGDSRTAITWGTQTTQDINFAVILEYFLRSGVDQSIWIQVTPRPPGDSGAEEFRDVVDHWQVLFQFGASSERIAVQQVRVYGRKVLLRFPTPKLKLCSQGWSLRDWVETMHVDIPNKTTILRLLDQGTSVTSTRPTTLADHGELATPTIPTAPLGHGNPETEAPPGDSLDHGITISPAPATAHISYYITFIFGMSSPSSPEMAIIS